MLKKALKNRYVVIFVLFVAWLTFFDQNNLFRQAEMSRQISDMEQEKKFYIEEIEKLKIEKKQLTTDRKRLEKHAREQFLMKKGDETLFVIEGE